MTKGILGKKIGMTQIFSEDGALVPVTVVQAGPCTVIQKKIVNVDGYSALQIGFESVDASSVNKPKLGHCIKAGKGVFKYLRELNFDNSDKFAVGDSLTVEQFNVGEYVDVVGTSIGKGFQGVIKRWNFKGGRASHGSRFHRAPGSIGASATPSHVFKNKKMPGQMGNQQITIQKLQIVRINAEDNLMMIKGAIPGHKNNIVVIKQSLK